MPIPQSRCALELSTQILLRYIELGSRFPNDFPRNDRVLKLIGKALSHRLPAALRAPTNADD